MPSTIDKSRALQELGVRPELAQFFVDNYDLPDVSSQEYPIELYGLAETLKQYEDTLAAQYPELYFPRDTEWLPRVNLNPVDQRFMQTLDARHDQGGGGYIYGATDVGKGDTVYLDQNTLASDKGGYLLGHELVGHAPRNQRAAGIEYNPDVAPLDYESVVPSEYFPERYQTNPNEAMAAMAGHDATYPSGTRVWDDPRYTQAFPDVQSKSDFLKAAYLHTPSMRSAEEQESSMPFTLSNAAKYIYQLIQKQRQ
jgi:hypothetical protein